MLSPACLYSCASATLLVERFQRRGRAHFDWDARSANMVSSFMIFGFVLGNLTGGFLQDKTNPRLICFVGCIMFCLGIFLTSLLTDKTVWLIYLTYSGLGGLGCGFAYGCVLSCLQKWFPHNRGFASGLSVSAFGLSTVLFGPVAQALLDRLGVPRTFMTLAGVFLAVTVTACCFVRLPDNLQNRQQSGQETETELKVSHASGLTPLQTMKLVPFWCIALSCFFINATWNIVVPVIKSLGMERGLVRKPRRNYRQYHRDSQRGRTSGHGYGFGQNRTHRHDNFSRGAYRGVRDSPYMGAGSFVCRGHSSYGFRLRRTVGNIPRHDNGHRAAHATAARITA